MLTRTPTMELRETQLNEEADRVAEGLIVKHGRDNVELVAGCAYLIGYGHAVVEQNHKWRKLLDEREEVIQALQGLKP